jgi:hypothetical protein
MVAGPMAVATLPALGNCGAARPALQRAGSNSPARPWTTDGASKVSKNAAENELPVEDCTELLLDLTLELLADDKILEADELLEDLLLEAMDLLLEERLSELVEFPIDEIADDKLVELALLVELLAIATTLEELDVVLRLDPAPVIDDAEELPGFGSLGCFAPPPPQADRARLEIKSKAFNFMSTHFCTGGFEASRRVETELGGHLNFFTVAYCIPNPCVCPGGVHDVVKGSALAVHIGFTVFYTGVIKHAAISDQSVLHGERTITEIAAPGLPAIDIKYHSIVSYKYVVMG